jgi:hypothetical protein
MKEMFDASVNGEEYDTDKWGAYFRPRGVQASNSAADHDDDSYVVAPRQQFSTPVVDEDEEPVVTSEVKVTTPQTSDTTANILAMIRSKKTSQA